MSSLRECCSEDLLAELRVAAVTLSERGLVSSSKWVSEQACSLAETVVAPVDARPMGRHDVAFWKEWDKYNMAKSYFDLKEFRRAAHFFRECRSNEAKFMRLYSLYLAGERTKDVPVLTKNAMAKVVNPELAFIRDELAGMADRGELDGYCSYLYGVTLNESSLTDEAVTYLVKAVNLEPMLWAAWQQLASLLTSVSASSSLDLPAHWMRDFFTVELHVSKQSEELLQQVTTLQQDVPSLKSNAYINSALASAHYDLRDFPQCSAIFNELRQADPCRLDFVDIFSNMLYVNGMEAELSRLAHQCVMVDKYRSETCFVIANYYSMRHNHPKAISYFQRALKLDRTYISAWTLLGHEFVEMKNVPAAIECYHTATALNPRDYRAWYGLGQTYEVLRLQNYSLYYYSKAQHLRPNDQRMLMALGESYFDLGQLDHAKRCYMRAINVGKGDAYAAVLALAKLYETQGQLDLAAPCFLQLIQLHTTGNQVALDSDLQDAYMFLGGYYRKKGNYDKLFEYGRLCMMFDETRGAGEAFLHEVAQHRGALSQQSMASP